MRRVVHLHLELTPGAEPLTGRIATEGAPPREFKGWIALNAAIDAALLAADAATGEERIAAGTTASCAPIRTR